MPTPEDEARRVVDGRLLAAGWAVQAYKRMNLGAGLGLAVTEFPGAHGPSDYLLYVDGKAVGVVEAKPAGHLYNVAFPRSNGFDPVCRVVVSTVQRLYSILTNAPETAADEDRSNFESAPAFHKPPVPVAYNPALPPEFFNVIVVSGRVRRSRRCARAARVSPLTLAYFARYMTNLLVAPQMFGRRQAAALDGAVRRGILN